MTTAAPDSAPSGQALPAGTRLEEFIIERVLGSGGFGITYQARDIRLDRQVVIKENLPAQFCYRDTHSLTVAPRHTSGEDVENFRWSLENFTREAAILASLDHPGIVKVLRSFEAFGTAYFVMPFVEGVTLDALLKERREQGQAFSENEMRGLLERLLDALAHLHDRGIYHRDIKPGNILMPMNGFPVLIDFGSARQRLSERSLTVIESPGYTPFEQLQSRGNVGPWSDLYAVGGTLCKAITGKAPPKANDRAFDDPWVPLVERAELSGVYSVGFLASIDRALAMRIEGRWQDAGQWLMELGVRNEAGSHVGGHVSSAQGTAADPARMQPAGTGKSKVLAWSAAACVLLGLGAWAMLSYSNMKEEAATARAKEAEYAKEKEEAARQAEHERQRLAELAKAEEEAAKKAEHERQRLAELAKAEEEAAKKAAEQPKPGDLNLDELAALGYYRSAYSAAIDGLYGSPAYRADIHSNSSDKDMAFSPDGRVLAIGTNSGRIVFMDAATGRELRSFPVNTSPVYSCAWSPDGKRLAATSFNKAICICDAETGKSVLSLVGHTAKNNSCEWSPDGKRLASASDDKTVRIWDAATGKNLFSLTGDTGKVYSCAWSSDGSRIASASYNNTIHIWDAATGKKLRSLTGHTSAVKSCAWNPDGKRLATGSWDNTVRIWDAASGKELTSFKGHMAPVISCVWSPNGMRLASASWDQTVRIWEAATGKELSSFSGHVNEIASCGWSPDGKRLASASMDQTVRIWDAATGKELRSIAGKSIVDSCAWNPDGKRLASSDWAEFRVWDLETGKELLSFTGHKDRIRSCVWNPDGSRIATASHDKTVRIWDSASGKELRSLTGHTGMVNSCSWSPDGSRLASSSDDATIRIWDAASGKELRSIPLKSGNGNSFAWSPNGKCLAAPEGVYGFRIWDVASGEEIRSFTEHTGNVKSCAWSPDGKLIACPSGDSTVRIWDAVSGKQLHLVRIPSNGTSIAFHPTKPNELAVGLNTGITIRLDTNKLARSSAPENDGAPREPSISDFGLD